MNKIDALNELDNLVKQKKDLIERMDNVTKLHQLRILEVNNKYEDKCLLLKAREKRIDDQIKMLLQHAEPRETKTTFKIELLEGDVIVSKEKIEPVKNDAILLSYLEEQGINSYTKETVKKSLDWSRLKSEIYLTENGVVLKETGEVFPVEVLNYKSVGGRVTVK